MATLAPASSEFVDALRRGLEAYDAGEIERASQLFDEALEIEPDNVWGLLWKGATAPTVGESKMWLEQAIAIDAHNEHARAGLRWANEQLAGSEDATMSMAPLTGSIATGTDEADSYFAGDYADEAVDEDVAETLDWLEESATPSESELDDFVTLLDRSESEPGTAAEENEDSDAASQTMESGAQLEVVERESAEYAPDSTTEAPDVTLTENDDLEMAEGGSVEDPGDPSGLPDWLSEGSSLTAEPDETGHAESVTELPDWLTEETSNGTGSLVAEATPSEPVEAEPSLPDWLKPSDKPADEGTDESLAVGEDAWATGDATESSKGEPELAQPAELPDWLVDDVPSSAASTELPDWLTAEDGPVTPALMSTNDEGQSADKLPEWLTDDASGESTASVRTDTVFPGSLSQEAQETPDAAPPADADLPDWLTGEGESTTPSVDSADLPDWLTGKSEPAVDTSDLPDWLTGSAAPAGEAVGELPSWLLGDDSTPFQATRGQGSLAPSDEVVEAYQAGLWAYEEDRLDDATRAFQRVIRLDPSHVEAHNYLGSVFYLNGRQDDAIVALRRALELDPVHSESYLNLGLVYKETGRNSQAVQMFNRYLDLAPADDTTTEYVREMIGQLGG